ncbi:beta-phosphoglucomutase [Flavobacterium aquatile]|uniref:Beta-phosphoglucomutase n=1 Tax=Flavobacterium aquatile LMG 4008 = ATCC 11947 TaxID=1453498 RepID=A0A095STH3_9FLAO|nr:beta-phosphoglucomutase [Flavobacterium aquatile]KGD67897.1 beta-phosphoglucomutase [Flavobacterium aquatile LMG 4008 = ATCC 11947]OXA65426.1 beta-phosphoglucomutase [Flavobacterium aquatile] [Flavobacterium aquatile LMG 4008 = ATCC 11947]GEC78989.1 beta-phosphoglucomutase [Flavobacterium aquatile]
MSKKAFIFDLDGVIVDTAKYHFLAWQKLAQELGIEFTPEHNEELKGVSRVRSLDIILELGNVTASQEDKNKWLFQKNEDYLSYLVDIDESEILPGVLPVLHYLKDKNQLIALGSASKNARPILEKTGILPLFDAIVDGNDVSNAKPDPEVFLRAAQLLNAKNEDAIVFEDSVAGVQAANIANMTSVGIGDDKILHEAKYNFKDFTFIDVSFIEALIN